MSAAHVIACDVCNDSGTIPHDGETLPCPMCDPAGAREAADAAPDSGVSP